VPTALDRLKALDGLALHVGSASSGAGTGVQLSAAD
jgi:hypothetical protein